MGDPERKPDLHLVEPEPAEPVREYQKLKQESCEQIAAKLGGAIFGEDPIGAVRFVLEHTSLGAEDLTIEDNNLIFNQLIAVLAKNPKDEALRALLMGSPEKVVNYARKLIRDQIK